MSAALDLAFLALANSHRRQIIETLSRGPATITSLRSDFAFSKQAMTKHVAALEQAGLVSREVEGRSHRLRLVRHPLDDVRAWIETRTALWESNFARLHELLGED
ncbi:MAG: helix-turn-helix domain-containing protein [Myxococcota bacterium]